MDGVFRGRSLCRRPLAPHSVDSCLSTNQNHACHPEISFKLILLGREIACQTRWPFTVFAGQRPSWFPSFSQPMHKHRPGVGS